jgi:uncharacterized protein (DUF924 family)
MTKHIRDEVLAFWLGTPATTADELLQKIRRWYQGTPQLDLEIDTRFGDVVEQALNDGLEGFPDDPRSRLALIIVLDQFARNLHRGTPRAYAGDARALALALQMLEGGDTAALPLEERLFALMPLVHTEDLEMQDRAVELSEQMVTAAPNDDLRSVWSTGAARTRHYRDIIQRFGRFPHRNAILGRKSSAEELAFLADEERTRSQAKSQAAILRGLAVARLFIAMLL